MKALMIGIVLVGMIFSAFGCSDDDSSGPDATGRVGWAIGHRGDTAAILHTADGGNTWKVVPHEGIAMIQVNRMDVKGGDYGLQTTGAVKTA